MTRRGGYSLIGMLVTMVCMAVLSVILLNAMNKATTGEGSAVQGTVRSVEDQAKLNAIHTAMFIHANENRGWYPVPHRIARVDDTTMNTTANLYSAMIALELVMPKTLIAGNEFSGYVEEAFDYDYTSYNPREGQYWDQGFRADLQFLSNASFAHMPMRGERFDKYWRNSMDSRFPVLGNRGPKDGIADPNSMTYGRNGVWGGHVCFGDGHVEFLDTFSPPNVVFEEDDAMVLDNIYALEDGPDGIDAILSFTKKITDTDLELDWD